jgi:outer membrane protein OmpU
MNKITKLGVSALCGSLAAVSAANAGDLAVTGGVDMTWLSMDDEITGNPIGIGSNVSFSGSGELDNGWGVALSIAYTNKAAYSSTNVTVTVPSMGDLIITQGGTGTGIDRMDDVTPNVWEEAYASGLSTGIQTVNGASGGAGFEFTPNMLPDGLTGRIAYTPDISGGSNNDKVSSGQSTSQGSAYDVTLVATDAITGMSGLTLGAGYGKTKSVTSANSDLKDETYYATYAVGGFTLGYQISEADLGTSANEQKYENDGYGITFNVNDDLSVGYNHYESKQTSTTNVTAEASSIQVAYSAGGASVRIMRATADNMDYSTAVNQDRDNTVVSVALAF